MHAIHKLSNLPQQSHTLNKFFKPLHTKIQIERNIEPKIQLDSQAGIHAKY